MFINRFALVAAAAAAVGLHGTPTTALTVLTGDHSVDGNLCVGTDCTGSETWGIEPLKLQSNYVGLLFHDTSTLANYPTEDWRIKINDTGAFGGAYFAVLDEANPILRLNAGAPAHSLYVTGGGDVGLGTSMPETDLQILSGYKPSIRFEQDTSGSFDAQQWEIGGVDSFFYLQDITNSTTGTALQTFRVYDDATFANFVVRNSRIGVNTHLPYATAHIQGRDGASDPALLVENEYISSSPQPEAFAHIRSNRGDTQLRVEELSGFATPRPLLNLVNNGRPEMLLANTNTGGEWSFGAGTNFVLKQGAVGSASSAKTKVLTATPAGDVTITGTLTTGGSTCGGGCDAVFSEGYDLPGIEQHAQAMFALGHLPNVGPTIENQPINVSDKLGRMLNELEHAHIYIARQNRRISDLAAQNAAAQARIAAQGARLARLEALIAGQGIAPRP